MRRITKSSPFFFPFSEGTTKHLFQELIIPAVEGYDIHFNVDSNFGGGRAIPMFFIENYRYLCTRWGIKNEKCKFVFINPDDLELGSKSNYLKLIYTQLGGKRSSNDYSKLVRDIRKQIKKGEDRVVIFFRAFNFLDFADEYFWGNIKSLVSGIDNVGVVLISYTGGLDLGSERYSRISDLLGQNIVTLKKLSDRDINYLIDRWAYLFERKYSEKEKKAIKEVSKGRPMVIKLCCVVLANSKVADNPKKILQNNEGISNIVYSQKLTLDDSSLKIGNSNVTYLFSEGELSVLKRFIKSGDKIITKDDIASALWKSRVLERYSESAISQMIRRIRDKLELMNFSRDTIQTAHGKGYIFRQK